VLRGAGDEAFVSGADISQFESIRNSAEAAARYDAIGDASMASLRRCAKPTIAMLHGWCLGGGVAIALNCDLRIADASMRFSIPAARLGLGYPWRAVKQLSDSVGPSNARRILLTARRFDAQDALRMGFVHSVVARGELEATIREECALIAANAPLTIAGVKAAMEEILRPGSDIDVERLEEATRRALCSADATEGRRAFMEKRPPCFMGR